MSIRIFSQVVCRAACYAALTATTFFFASNAKAQTQPGYVTDPNTGIVYRQSMRTVERPVVETQVETRQQTVYRPKTVTENRPETRTYYTPVVEYQWTPKVHGRWNPFRKPTVAYHHVPVTSWERRDDVVNRTTTRTQWVAENRTVEVPRRVVRMEHVPQVDLEPVGNVAPNSPSSAIASRMRPLNSSEQVVPLTQGPTTQIASTVGRLSSDPPRRSASQSGMRSTDLAPNPPVYSQPLPPASSGIGVAMPSLPFLR